MSSQRTGAAFFRLETALTHVPAWRNARALSAQAPSIRARLSGLGVGTLAGALGLHPALGGASAAARAGWSQLRGFTRDRVEVLGADLANDDLFPLVAPHARRLIDEARARGLRPVLIAETIRAVAEPLALALGIEPALSISSDLVWSANDEATGELAEGVIGPELKPRDLERFADEHAISLELSAAYGGAASDVILLSRVGLPCALDPDAELARIARELGWPIVRGAIARTEARA